MNGACLDVNDEVACCNLPRAHRYSGEDDCFHTCQLSCAKIGLWPRAGAWSRRCDAGTTGVGVCSDVAIMGQPRQQVALSAFGGFACVWRRELRHDRCEVACGALPQQLA